MKHYSVLVVDDNTDAAELLAVMLSGAGWRASAVFSGKEALDLVEQDVPDVVLLDIGMPGMSGLAVAQTLRHRYGPACPVMIALTAWGDEETKVACREAGMVLHLTKPVEMSVFLATLDEFRSPHVSSNS